MQKTNRNRRGFSLVELLTVITIIGILAAIIIPSIGGIQRAAFRSKTRGQLQQYIIAYEQFRAQYGFYPSMGESNAVFHLKDNNEVFIETLSGRTKDGETQLTQQYARLANKKRLLFYQFSESEFAPEDSPYVGELVDGFENPNIVVVVDRNLDGIIPAEDLPVEEDVKAGVAIYTEIPEDTDNGDWEVIYSWE